MRRTFLVIDGQPEAAEQIARQLKACSQGAEVLLAPTAGDALTLLEERRIVPSMIVSSFDLPDMNALELLGHIRDHRWLQPAPFMVVGDAFENRDVVACYKLGACALLTRPIRPHELREAVRDFAIEAFELSSATLVPGSPRSRARWAA